MRHIETRFRDPGGLIGWRGGVCFVPPGPEEKELVVVNVALTYQTLAPTYHY